MFKSKSKVSIGDQVLVLINKGVEELEVIDLPQPKPKKGKDFWLFLLTRLILGKSYPSRVVVKLPNGKPLECQFFPVARY